MVGVPWLELAVEAEDRVGKKEAATAALGFRWSSVVAAVELR